MILQILKHVYDDHVITTFFIYRMRLVQRYLKGGIRAVLVVLYSTIDFGVVCTYDLLARLDFDFGYEVDLVPSLFNPRAARILATVMLSQCYTPTKEKRRFLYFNHLSKEFLEQMIPHLKALI